MLKGKAIPTGIQSPDTPNGIHYKLEPSWWPDGQGEYVLVSTVGKETMIFLSDEKATRPDGLLTPCIQGYLHQHGYTIDYKGCLNLKADEALDSAKVETWSDTNLERQTFKNVIQLECTCGSVVFEVAHTADYETSARCYNCNKWYIVHSG